MNPSPKKTAILSLLAVTAALSACKSSSSTGKPTETTAGKVSKERTEALERLDESASIVADFSQKVPDEVARSARCVIAIPSMVKGGVIIGGQSGKGFASCQTASGWSAPAPVSIGGGTVGAQLGVQSTDYFALVTSQRGATALASGNFKIGVDASASAGPVGTGRGSAATDVVSYSRAQGLFAGANLNGSTIKLDEDSTKALYGSKQPLGAILGGQVSAPSDATSDRFISAVGAGFGPQRTVSPPRS
jgi:lipid-binding SYLF domain-containing protein